MSTSIRTIVRFTSEAEALRFWENMITPSKSFRVADYGADGNNAEPYWLAVDQLRFPSLLTQAQLERWKACGHANL